MRRSLLTGALLIAVVFSKVFAQDAPPDAEEQQTWLPPEDVPVYKFSREDLLLHLEDGSTLEQPTSLFGKFNRLYVFDGELGHAYLFDAKGRFLTQLTDPHQPVFHNVYNDDSETPPAIHDADSFGRLLFSSNMLVDGVQYRVPLSHLFHQAGLFQGSIVTLTHPRGENWREKGIEIAAYSLLGGRIYPPWAIFEKGKWYQLIATLENKLYLLDLWEKLLTVVDDTGKSETVHLAAIDVGHRVNRNGDEIKIPQLSSMHVDEKALYFKINTSQGKNYICAFSHSYQLVETYELPMATPFYLHEFTVCFVDEHPIIYAMEIDWKANPARRRLVRYLPLNNEKAPAN